MIKLFSGQVSRFTRGLFRLMVASRILIIVNVMRYSSLNWKWRDVILSRLSLLLKWSTPIEGVDVWQVGGPPISCSNIYFWHFRLLQHKSPPSFFDLRQSFDLVLPLKQPHFLLHFTLRNPMNDLNSVTLVGGLNLCIASAVLIASSIRLERMTWLM